MTRVNRAGNRAVTPAPGDHDLARFQRLAQRVEHVAAELGRLVQEQAAVVGQRCGAGPDDAAAAADDRRTGGGVVRGAERRLGDAAAGPGGSAPATEWMALTSGRRRARAAAAPSGSRSASIVLPDAWRPEQQQVMPACRADLGGPPGDRLADDIGQVRVGCGASDAARLPGAAASAWAGCVRLRSCPREPVAPVQSGRAGTPSGGQPVAQPSATRPGWPRRRTCNPGTSAASAAFSAGTTTAAKPALLQPQPAGSTPRTGRNRPSRPSSPSRTQARQPGRGHAARRPPGWPPRCRGRSRCRAWAGWPGTGRP